MTRQQRSQAVHAAAARLGFDACGIANAEAEIDPEDRLGRWLGAGYHADMAWMARSKAVRQDSHLRLSGARAVVVVARNYYSERPEPRPGTGKVAAYAWGRDYHRALRKPLRQLADAIEALESGTETIASIDSGPVLERAWAARAGIGWIGKNSLVLHPRLGSWFFLATVTTTLEMAPDEPIEDACGSCRACIDACPTEAIVADRMVDSRRCISYHTIENRDTIPDAVAGRLDGWVFGCDICQEVCPWTRFAKPTDCADFAPRPGHANLDLEGLVEHDDAQFRERFSGTPIMRAKRGGMARNAAALLALENGATACETPEPNDGDGKSE